VRRWATVNSHADRIPICDVDHKSVLPLGTQFVVLVELVPLAGGPRIAQQARNLSMFFEQQAEHKPMHIIRDRNSKFTGQFYSILESEGMVVHQDDN
jgi:hypothetical protein